jgi:superoxide reductase
MKERAFFRCNLCRNIVEMIVDGGGKLICCGEEMEQLKAGSVDAAHEKHVPVYEKEGNTLRVQVGSVAHPMLEEHWIEWIQVNEPERTQRVMLKAGEEPEAVFHVKSDDFEVYEYCNLHGLWKG